MLPVYKEKKQKEEDVDDPLEQAPSTPEDGDNEDEAMSHAEGCPKCEKAIEHLKKACKSYESGPDGATKAMKHVYAAIFSLDPDVDLEEETEEEMMPMMEEEDEDAGTDNPSPEDSDEL